MKKRFYIFLIITLPLIGMISCKSNKSNVSSPAVNQTSASDGYTSLTSAIENIPTDWNTLQVPVSLSTDKPTSFKASARAYMTRDSSIYLSFTLLGMEMAALQITNDSIFAVDKMHRRYVSEDIRTLTTNYPVSVSTLQNLFMGQIFLPGVNKLNSCHASEFKTVVSGDKGMSISPKSQFKPFELIFDFDNDSRLIKCDVKSPNSDISVCYNDYTSALGGYLPQTDNIQFDTKKIDISATLKWNWNKVRVNNPSDSKKININPSYTKVTAAQLLNSFN